MQGPVNARSIPRFSSSILELLLELGRREAAFGGSFEVMPLAMSLSVWSVLLWSENGRRPEDEPQEQEGLLEPTDQWNLALQRHALSVAGRYVPPPWLLRHALGPLLRRGEGRRHPEAVDCGAHDAPRVARPLATGPKPAHANALQGRCMALSALAVPGYGHRAACARLHAVQEGVSAQSESRHLRIEAPKGFLERHGNLAAQRARDKATHLSGALHFVVTSSHVHPPPAKTFTINFPYLIGVNQVESRWLHSEPIA